MGSFCLSLSFFFPLRIGKITFLEKAVQVFQEVEHFDVVSHGRIRSLDRCSHCSYSVLWRFLLFYFPLKVWDPIQCNLFTGP